jgi:DNA-binding transcriptional MerR regulator
MAWTVGEVARLAQVSVRTLHHYEAIGLLQPSGRSAAGYRLYTPLDLARLQQILLHRELGFRLGEIGRVLDDPGFDRRAALVAQRAALAAQIARSTALLGTIDRTLRSLAGEETMTDEEMFDGFDPAAHEQEVEARWGQTRAHAESKARTSRYTKSDWDEMKAEAAAITADLAAALADGVPPVDPRATALAERHRLHIDRWFYPCSKEMHARLGDLYVSDERFAASYDRLRPGLAAYVRDAIGANLLASP